ncbi:MAG: DUF6265 family protein [Bacteroidota bacterium]
MKKLLLIPFTFFCLSAYCQNKNTFDCFAGKWISIDKDGNKTTEIWKQNNMGFDGFSQTISNKNEIVFSETLYLQQFGNHWCYVASLKNSVTLFKLKEANNNVFVFENKEHDFPQFIEYNCASKDTIKVKIGNSKKNENWMYIKSN